MEAAEFLFLVLGLVVGVVVDLVGCRQVVDHAVQQRLHAFVLQRSSEEDRSEAARETRASNGRLREGGLHNLKGETTEFEYINARAVKYFYLFVCWLFFFEKNLTHLFVHI